MKEIYLDNSATTPLCAQAAEKMTLKQFEDTMSRLGVKAFGARGEEFNPEFHNAVMQTEDEELGENKIADVLQKGYSKGDKIIRYAMVKVTV